MARASKAAAAAEKSPAKTTATRASAKKAVPAKAATKKATAKKAVPKKATAKKAVPKKATAKKATAEKAVPKKATANKATTKKAAPNTAGTTPAEVTPTAPTKKKTVTKSSDAASNTSKAASAPKRAKKAKPPFDSRFLERQRKLLKVERDTYERQAINLKAEADSLVMDMDPGDVQFDEESGEGDTIAVERGRDLALAAKAWEMIEEIDHAMTKFDLGTYGICEVSGEPIPEERLEAIPWAREKVEFKVGGFGRR